MSKLLLLSQDNFVFEDHYIIDKIVDGRIEKFYAESCLLEQQFIKDPDRKIGDLMTEAVATLGENIVINRFIRFAVGESSLNGQLL